MNIGLMIGLTRARVALLVMGLAWLVGLSPPLFVRIALVVLISAALLFDGLLDERRIQHAQPTPSKTTTH